ncbi:acetyltransferase [Desulfosporosinus acidiphilus SJ4]|uniref:Acetyltransferase n=1 Tax=Desulfosporosinus acidiphilus (strain DSM 22704 / JCM 16185 / SJ4) TaxID=646529 RepID=I4D6U0_DESAJ|nr:GNAT family N-acetyltransferase [Desulfosporosinus acidiphilus]AFM41514.1 acetyltransferase [Desulfosporosinus acidiphilus SJ4]
MNISLTKAELKDAETIHVMQTNSFMPLLEKYQDFETSPANEPIEKIVTRLNQSFTDYYVIKNDGVTVGAIRIIKMGDQRYRVSPIFILPEYQGKGFAQKVFEIIERVYCDARAWELDTLLQEKGNCHLYEKLGYKRTGKMETINRKMTLVFYEKYLTPSQEI